MPVFNLPLFSPFWKIANDSKSYVPTGVIHLVCTQSFPKKLTFRTPWYAHVRVYQGVRNVGFSESFAYVLNEWPYSANTHALQSFEVFLVAKSKSLFLFASLW